MEVTGKTCHEPFRGGKTCTSGGRQENPATKLVWKANTEKSGRRQKNPDASLVWR